MLMFSFSCRVFVVQLVGAVCFVLFVCVCVCVCECFRDSSLLFLWVGGWVLGRGRFSRILRSGRSAWSRG